jgi:hypothetical protein
MESVRSSFAPAVLGVILALALASGASSGTLSTTQHAGLVRVAIDSNAAFPDAAATARGHQFVILQSWKTDLARQLKAANPELKVLAYKNFSFVACDAYAGGRYVPQGVRCPDVEANHPEWFLTDAAGNRLQSSGYSWLWLLDVGNPAYQDAWADGVIEEARADGWDGVFMDDVNPTVKYHMDSAAVARYPNDAAWRAATRSMLERVGPRIRAAGLLAVANLCCAREYDGVWREWLPSLSGAMEEMFTKFGNDPATGYVWDWGAGGWSTQVEQVREAEAQGKYFLGIAHSQATDARAAGYGLTTMLLASQGRSSFALAQDYTNETRFPIYDRAQRLGAPTGPYFRAGAAYRRNFAAGTVVVNPTLTSVTVALGAEYVTEAGARVTSVTLGATSGTVLLTTGEPAPPPSDTIPPETTITSGPSGTVRSASATFAFLSSEAGSRFECRLDSGAFVACTSPAAYAGLGAGNHTFAVRAIDAARNADPTPATRSWRVKLGKVTWNVLFTTTVAQARVAAGEVRRVRLRVSGRVLARVAGRPASRVTLYRRTARGWKPVARVRTNATGRFYVKHRIRTAAGLLRLRAVAASSGLTARSRVLVIGVRVRK